MLILHLLEIQGAEYDLAIEEGINRLCICRLHIRIDQLNVSFN